MFELGRHLAQRHELHLFRLGLLPPSRFDLDECAEKVFTYRYSSAGPIGHRVRNNKWFPESFTLFHPLEKTHRQIALDINAGSYDVAIVHPDAFTQSPHLLRWLRGLPSIYYCQEPLRVYRERNLREARSRLPRDERLAALHRLDRRLSLRLLAGADLRNVIAANVVVANSYFSREQIWAAYARDAVVCYLGVDEEQFSPGTGIRRSEVLCVGPATAAKAQDLVIEALARVDPGSRPSLRLVMPVASDTSALRRLASQLSVDLIVEQGISDADLVERYRTALATVCTARLEPFGLSPLESMACATPVIAVNEGGFRESVQNGETGFLVDRDARGIAAAILKLSTKPELVRAMGFRGRDEVCQRWTWRISSHRFETIILEAIE